jgi:putative Holliday junction resolvase
VRLGVDVGKARIGVSRSDPGGSLALPVETVRRATDGGDLSRLCALVAEYEAVEVIVGLPLSLSGGRTRSTDDAVEFGARLAARLGTGVGVRLVDERLSTVSAQSALHEAGRSTKGSRSVIDQAAAAIILQHALDSERSTGAPPGTLIDPNQDPAS